MSLNAPGLFRPPLSWRTDPYRGEERAMALTALAHQLAGLWMPTVPVIGGHRLDLVQCAAEYLVRGGVVGFDGLCSILMRMNQDRCSPPLSSADIKALVDDTMVTYYTVYHRAIEAGVLP